MGKTYVDVVKYLIKASLEVAGIVEKPDIVGAIFGQTEGLLGDELDLRELQKSGRIGRIEVDVQVRQGKCIGSVTIPSSLDMVETSILAAALEIVDRVGPCDARIAVQRIEDTRNLKRKQVLGRARDLLRTMLTSEIPESKELSEMVRDELKIAEVVSYGPENLPAGPAIDASPDIIVCEGRADVINLLKNGIKNAVAIGGANVGKGIADLCRKKEVTAFLDGDRGGDIILRELVNATEIEFVARAPPGHEVEELSRKEIIQCIRRKVPTEQALAQMDWGGNNQHGRPSGGERFSRTEPRERDARDAPQRDSRYAPATPVRRERPGGLDARIAQLAGQIQHQPAAALVQDVAGPSTEVVVTQLPPAKPVEPEPQVAPEIAGPLKATLKELSGSLKARFLAADGSIVNEVSIRDIITSLGDAQNVSSVVLDGIVTQRLLDLAESRQVKFVCGIRQGNITRKPASIGIVAGE